MQRRHTTSTLFPYTTLFRSLADVGALESLELENVAVGSLSFLSRLERLRALELKGVGKVPSLSFLRDRKSTRLNSSHTVISYAVFCLKKKKISPFISKSFSS